MARDAFSPFFTVDPWKDERQFREGRKTCFTSEVGIYSLTQTDVDKKVKNLMLFSINFFLVEFPQVSKYLECSVIAFRICSVFLFSLLDSEFF